MASVVALRERIEVLEYENQQLRVLAAPLKAEYLGIGLSRNERIIFAALMSGEVICNRDYLIDCLSFVRGAPVEVQPKAIDLSILRLRRKLAGLGFPGVLRTEWGTGYCIRPEDKARLKRFFAGRS